MTFKYTPLGLLDTELVCLWQVTSSHWVCGLLPSLYWTLNMLNCFKDYQRCIHIFYHILGFVHNRRSPNSQWSNPIYCLCYTDNTMPADSLATLGAKAPAGMALTPRAEIFRIQHQKSWLKDCSICSLVKWGQQINTWRREQYSSHFADEN